MKKKREDMATKKKIKVVKKAVKKAIQVKKTVKKAAKKTVKATVKKAAKKIAAKPAKKAARKPAKKSAAKPAKKSTKKATQSPVKKPVPKMTPIQTPKPTSKANVDYSKAITPLGDRLVVRVLTGERITAGGLIIPDSASLATGYLKATVMAVGAGGKSKKGLLRPLDVKVGDSVLFSEHSGTKVNFNAEELQIIHESDVMGVVQN